MIQRHSIILWKKAEKKEKSFEEIAQEIYKTLDIFQMYPVKMRPNYLTGLSQKEIKEFNWNLQNFSHMLKKGINREGDTEFEKLGYSISFFSDINNQDSWGFEIVAGNKSEKFFNSLVINLPLSLNVFDKKEAEIINCLFEKLVQNYKPFWGCVSNKALSRKYGKFLEGNLPTTIHWINSWSEDIMRTIGIEKIQKLVERNPMVSLKNGILVIKDVHLI